MKKLKFVKSKHQYASTTNLVPVYETFNHFACVSISAPTNISIIPVMALFITIRTLYGKGKVKTTPVRMP